MANEATSFKAGLEGIVANTSEVSFIDGQEGRLLYHGYNIHDLVNGGASFEEVIYLLWNGRLPNQSELNEFAKSIATQRALQPHVLQFLREIPKDANAMEVLRTAVSFLGLYDGDEGNESREANIRKATRLVAKIPTVVTTFERIRQGLEPVQPDETLSMAASFFYLLRGEKPSEFEEKAFNVALILHADHELNASTFAARVTSATLTDMYSAITSAIGALKGPLHGGANEQVMKMLLEINDPEKAEAWIDNALTEKKKIMGFGHRVYRTEDPRATHLRGLSKEAGELAGETKWNDMSLTIEKMVNEKKGLFTNVDFYSGSMYYSMGIPTHLFTPIFACSRVAGWTAHVLEQQSNNRIIRPRAEYVGPTNLSYVPVNER